MLNNPQDILTERQLQLIDAGLRVLDREGGEGLSMRKLADEAGLSPMATYKHFENQEAFQIELWMSCMYTFNRGMLDGVEAHPDRPIEGFIALCRAFMAYAFRWPRRFEYVMTHPLIERIRETDTENQRRALWAVAVRSLERARDAGEIRTDQTVQALTLSVLAQLHGASHMVLTGRAMHLTGMDADAVLELTSEMIRTSITGVPSPALPTD